MRSNSTMRLVQFALLSTFLLCAANPVVAATRTRRSPTSQKPATKAKAKPPLGPRAIDDARATQLQAALIQSGYLTGDPSGHWDPATEAAMQKLQADNGWQTKLVPDSRAIIKLGLGPSTAGVAAPTDPTP
jgi:hypothetical protein